MLRNARCRFFSVPILAALAVVAPAALGAPDSKSQEKSISLFNGKDLTGWHTYIRHEKSDAKVDPGAIPRGSSKLRTASSTSRAKSSAA